MISESTWTIESNKSKDLLIAFISIAVGLLAMWLVKNQSQGSTNALAGFWLGILLFGGGVVAFIFAEKVTVKLDLNHKRLMVLMRLPLGTDTLNVAFSEVDCVGVSRQGSSKGYISYNLWIRLKNGKEIQTRRWSMDQSEILEVAERLAASLGCALNRGAVPIPANAKKISIALIGAVGVYSVGFRVMAGPWCWAMWYGTLPPIAILFSFSAILLILRRFYK